MGSRPEFLLSTERLDLVEMAATDLDFVAGMLADPEVMQHYPAPHSRDESLAWIERQRARYAREGHGLWLVRERSSGEPVGQAGLVLQTVGPEAVEEREIGYLLARPCWRRGYATEAALAVKRWAFETLELRRVVSLIRPGNLPSQAVARRIGMAPEREVIFHERPHVVFACANPRLA